MGESPVFSVNLSPGGLQTDVKGGGAWREGSLQRKE